MKRKTCPILYALLLAAAHPALADEGHDHHGGQAHDGHPMHASEAGKPGNPAKAGVTVQVVTLDSMRYEPAQFAFKRGQTVKFVVTNKGQLPHEFGIGSLQEQKGHAEMMKSMPDMKHDDPSVVTLEPGQTRELVWQFTRRGTFQIGCHVSGHYEAGMAAAITVQ